MLLYLVYHLQVPKGELSTYCPMPLLISTKGYGLQIDTYYRSVLQAYTTSIELEVTTPLNFAVMKCTIYH